MFDDKEIEERLHRLRSQNILNVEDRIKELGYEHLLAFYYGRSKFNNGLFGWSGHSKNGSTLMSVEGLPK